MNMELKKKKRERKKKYFFIKAGEKEIGNKEKLY